MIDASPAGLLDVWSRAAALPAAERGRLLLDGQTDADRWPLGRRDTELARIFRTLYGDDIAATVRCESCGELLEFETTIGTLYDVCEPDRTGGPFSLRHGGYDLTLRPLAANDLAGLPSTPAAAVACVLRRCVSAVRRSDSGDARDIDVAQLPASTREAIANALNAADPAAEISLALECARCGSAASVAFDMAAFLWEHVRRDALAIVSDVHELASAYGWAECDILALPDERRRRYLELIGR